MKSKAGVAICCERAKLEQRYAMKSKTGVAICYERAKLEQRYAMKSKEASTGKREENGER